MVGALLVGGVLQLSAATAEEKATALFERGRTFEQFLDRVSSQRELWIRNAAAPTVAPLMVRRLQRVGGALRLLIVAEDWCPDSVNTVPYIVRLASLADVPARIVDRRDGQAIMQRHRASDGRTVTPVVVLLRGADDVGAWIERPRALQQRFLGLRANPEESERFARRQSWYDADRGETTVAEIVALAERTAPTGKK